MNDFKVGDRVEYVGADSIVRNPLLMGSIGCVSHSGDASVMVSWDDPGRPRHGVLATNLRHITPAQDVITIDRADLPDVCTHPSGLLIVDDSNYPDRIDAAEHRLEALKHLAAVEFLEAREKAAEEAKAAEKEAAEKLNNRRDELAVEVAKRACYVNFHKFSYEDYAPGTQAAIDMIIELEADRV